MIEWHECNQKVRKVTKWRLIYTLQNLTYCSNFCFLLYYIKISIIRYLKVRLLSKRSRCSSISKQYIMMLMMIGRNTLPYVCENWNLHLFGNCYSVHQRKCFAGANVSYYRTWEKRKYTYLFFLDSKQQIKLLFYFLL